MASNGSANGNANNNNPLNKSGSFLEKIDVFGLFGNSSNKKSANGAINKQVNAKVVATALPVTAGPQNGMRGGMASVSYSTPYDMRQPSERVMQWATTAGAPTPTGPEMRNVAHGGKRRRTHKRKTHRHRKSKRSTGGRKCTMKRKTHRRRHNKRRHSRRN